jgi:ribosomal protein S18 acetylase RimI-like enzyme
MDDQFILRRAEISDKNTLSQLHQRTFRETFVEDFSIPIPAHDLDSYFRSSANPEWFANKILDPRQAVWVIQDKSNGELVAYALVGLCDVADMPHPDVSPNKDGELNRLYIRRDRQSFGFGRQLMSVILSWLEEHYPARPIWLNVWSRNFKAQTFYAHYGFSKVGEFDEFVGEWKGLEFIMKRQPNTS